MDNKVVLPADILWVCDTLYSENYQVKAHAHITYYHLIYIRSGVCRVTVNGQTYELSPGMVMVAMPEDVHSIHQIPEGSEVRFWEIKFIVYSRSINNAFKEIDRVFAADEVENGLLEDIIHNSYGTGRHININAGRFYLSALLYHVCGDVMNSYKQESASHYLQGIDTSNFSRATIETVQYVEENYMHEVSLEQIGNAIGYYKNYISTAVKKDLSITVNELLSFVRIQKAAELLYYSDYSIKQIYTQTGFKNINHFTRIFKKMVGIPPAQYRRSFPDGVLETTHGISNHDDSVPMWVRGLLRDYIESKPD